MVVRDSVVLRVKTEGPKTYVVGLGGRLIWVREGVDPHQGWGEEGRVLFKVPRGKGKDKRVVGLSRPFTGHHVRSEQGCPGPCVFHPPLLSEGLRG